MADELLEEAGLEPALTPASSPLVQLSFQRNTNRKQKYLEAEPKILGVTQIGLSCYQIINVAVFFASNTGSFHHMFLDNQGMNVPFFIASLLVVIAGSVAVAAQNLHLPTLRACLAMQILACAACGFNVIYSVVEMELYLGCWRYHMDDNSTQVLGQLCHQVESAHSHLYVEGVVIHVTLLAISATLAAYCCKVVNCCAPAPKMPVIVLQAPPPPQ